MCRIFIDMDGTIVVYNTKAELSDFKRKGYFTSLQPNWTMLNAVKLLIQKNYDIYILSAVYVDTEDPKNDKIEWLHEYLPEIWEYYDNPEEHLIFTPVGENKLDYIDHPLSSDILLDDYTKNLVAWEKGIPVKCVNGINWSNGTWHGYSVDIRSDAEYIAKMIQGIVLIESIPDVRTA